MVEEEEEEERQARHEFGDLDEEQVEERDRGLWEASMTTRQVIRDALQTCQQKKVGNAVLEYIDRPEFGGRPDWRPFYAKHKVETIRKYVVVWVKVLRFIWRTIDVDEKERPRYGMTSRQIETFEEMRQLSRREERRMRDGRKR